MDSKHKLDNIGKMLYILYTIFLIYPLKSLVELGILSTDIRFFEIIANIGIGNSIEFYAFEFLFLFMMYIGINTEGKNIKIFEDDEKLNKLNSRLVPYKLFVTISIIGVTVLLLLTKDKNLLAPSVLLICASILIYYCKETYIKSYLFDRQLNYLEKITGEKYDDSDIDSKKWRYKIWYDNKEKIKMKDRRFNIIVNILNILFFGTLFIINGAILGTILWGYLLITNIFKLIENIFSLFTTIEGVCTGFYEEHKRNAIYYHAVITDYNTKREIKVRLRESYYIEHMDRLTVVHGVLSKQLVSINNIKLGQLERGNVFPILFLVIIFVIPTISNYTGSSIEDLNSKLYNNLYKDEEYIDFDERQKLENDRDLLSLDEIGKYEIIDLSKEQEFNDVVISFDKLYLGKKASKIYFSIANNTDKGMVINVNYNTIITGEEGKNSNILLPGKKYNLEMDILEEYNKKDFKTLLVNLEYTLSDTILNEYLDFSYYYHYPLNVIDNDCMTYINLESNEVDMNFNDYNEFYTKNNEVVKFKP